MPHLLAPASVNEMSMWHFFSRSLLWCAKWLFCQGALHILHPACLWQHSVSSWYQQLPCLPNIKIAPILLCHWSTSSASLHSLQTLGKGSYSPHLRLPVLGPPSPLPPCMIHPKMDNHCSVSSSQLCRIDSQDTGALPGYVFTLMTIYFLQQCRPPVLPVLHEVCSYELITRLEDCHASACNFHTWCPSLISYSLLMSPLKHQAMRICTVMIWNVWWVGQDQFSAFGNILTSFSNACNHCSPYSIVYGSAAIQTRWVCFGLSFFASTVLSSTWVLLWFASGNSDLWTGVKRNRPARRSPLKVRIPPSSVS